MTIHTTLEQRPPWHSMAPALVSGELSTDPDVGLAAGEVERRLERYGPNVLEVAGRTPWYVVLGRQFVDVLILILGVAAVVSIALGEATDAITIVVILVLNGVLGFVQEWRAEQAIEALQKLLALEARVVRDGREQAVDATGLVPGDLVAVEIGGRIPADLRIVQAVDLKVDESPLTGESESVSKSPDVVAVEDPARRAALDGLDGDHRHQRSRQGPRRRHRHDDRVRADRRAHPIGRSRGNAASEEAGGARFVARADRGGDFRAGGDSPGGCSART